MMHPAPPMPVGDPLHYKILAGVLFVASLTFLIAYAHEVLKGRRLKDVGPFAAALLSVAVALVLYSSATLLRQVLGPEYSGRGPVRSAASAILSSSLFVLTWVLRRSRRRD